MADLAFSFQFLDNKCNPGLFGIIGNGKDPNSKVGFDQQAIVGLAIWMCCILYSSIRSASSSSKLTMSEHVLVKDGGGKIYDYDT